MKLASWDWRPAVYFDDERAFAVLEPGGPWVPVDAMDVGETSSVLREDLWRRKFEDEFGPLDLSKIPAQSPDRQLSSKNTEADLPKTSAA
jgi:hypothetical protein